MSNTHAIAQIKQRLSLLEAVRKRVPEVKKKGAHWWACCPFHSEKSPSFHVRPEQGSYYCFGCGAAGDIFTFEQALGGGDFGDVLERLAAEAGVELEKRYVSEEEKQQRLDGLSALSRAAGVFQQNLPRIQSYVKGRGLSSEICATFGLGYAQEGWQALGDELRKDGFTNAVLTETGLGIQSDKNPNKPPYDRFRDRLMFPIWNTKNEVIAFGGRILVKEGEKTGPKYLNSPDTPFFNKSYTLYNLNQAAEHMRREKQALLVEGYMDVIGLWQAGIQTAVAPLGTAVTAEQIELLWRYHPTPTVCLDGDAAGQKAAVRAAKRALPFLSPTNTLHFVFLPEGEDPDSFVQTHGAEAFKAHMAKAVPLEAVLWNSIVMEVGGVQHLQSPQGRAQAEELLQNTANDIKHPLVQKHLRRYWLDQLWQATGGSAAGGKKANKGVKGERTFQTGLANYVPKGSTSLVAEELVGAFCQSPEWAMDHLDVLANLPLQGDAKLMQNALLQWLVKQTIANEALTDEKWRAYIITSHLSDPHENARRQWPHGSDKKAFHSALTTWQKGQLHTQTRHRLKSLTRKTDDTSNWEALENMVKQR